MMTTLSLQEYKRVSVQVLHNAGLNLSNIMQRTGFRKDYCLRWIERSREEHGYKNRKGSGRHRKLAPDQEQFLMRTACGKLHTSLRRLSQIVCKRYNIESVSRETIRNCLRRNKLKSFARPKKPLLSQNNITKRLQFARKYTEPKEHIQNIVFTDEVHFELDGYPNSKKNRVWAKERKEVEPVRTVCKSQTIRLWGALLPNNTIYVRFYENTLNAQKYVSILERFFEHCKRTKELQDILLQQDGASCHAARFTNNWLQRNGIRYISSGRSKHSEWPPYSPDLNPIECLWALLKDRVYAKQPQSLKHLKRAILRALDKVTPQQVQRLRNSFYKRLEAVKTAEGKSTHY